ncbi:MAG: hypothetical protein COU11_03150 [Candidatus Harrisonbacteria bacterium CG10_big_fil_rev_8_21_14_0_10_49_15]|uniref:Uncharacterized protein n=1 Tax=Candidatus Harrisonbacteria bacterium CG10_big_fil_rev_8_21_14_0_10_49_15 TaxID=1974587 RepID=A0A2H0UKQ2_9BACT|nr:MAG: hypothetical protein COU11_03150 [Candidatus Harrisonbacteria bacterium CG10_big_fil_rev_8_21_14_0_10_49_15]
MLDFVIQMAFMASLAVIVYMLARAMPRVAEQFWEEDQPKSSLDRFLERIPLERIDIALHQILIKMLRKSKIVILKIDNAINEYLEQLKKKSGSSGHKEHMDLLSGNGNGKELPPEDPEELKEE